MEGNLRFKIDWALFEGNFASTSPRGAYIWRGDFALLDWGAYIWRGLFSEFYCISKVKIRFD